MGYAHRRFVFSRYLIDGILLDLVIIAVSDAGVVRASSQPGRACSASDNWTSYAQSAALLIGLFIMNLRVLVNIPSAVLSVLQLSSILDYIAVIPASAFSTVCFCISQTPDLLF